jgi:hypothetical protein
MGDIADYINSNFPDTYWEEDIDGWYDDYPPAYAKSKKQLMCNKCGSKQVKWGQYPSGKWFLFTGGVPHKCE